MSNRLTAAIAVGALAVVGLIVLVALDVMALGWILVVLLLVLALLAALGMPRPARDRGGPDARPLRGTPPGVQWFPTGTWWSDRRRARRDRPD